MLTGKGKFNTRIVHPELGVGTVMYSFYYEDTILMLEVVYDTFNYKHPYPNRYGCHITIADDVKLYVEGIKIWNSL